MRLGSRQTQPAARGGLGVFLDDDIDVVPEFNKEAPEAVDREDGEATASERRDLRLIDPEEFGGLDLGEIARLDLWIDTVSLPARFRCSPLQR